MLFKISDSLSGEVIKRHMFFIVPASVWSALKTSIGFASVEDEDDLWEKWIFPHWGILNHYIRLETLIEKNLACLFALAANEFRKHRSPLLECRWDGINRFAKSLLPTSWLKTRTITQSCSLSLAAQTSNIKSFNNHLLTSSRSIVARRFSWIKVVNSNTHT